jgi:hypothetical protein
VRIVGDRKERPITFSASAQLLKEGAKFNDRTLNIPGGNTSFIPKGVYRFKNHEDANAHWELSLAKGMASLATKKNDGIV